MRPKVSDFDPCYFDRDLVDVVMTWPPEIIDNREWLKLYDARIISGPWEDRNRAGLTQVGVWLQKRLREAGGPTCRNFFPVLHVLEVWPIGLLANRRDDIGAYLTLFGLSWNDPNVRRYVAKGLEANPREPWTLGLCDDPTRAAWGKPATLQELIAELGEAVVRNIESRK